MAKATPSYRDMRRIILAKIQDLQNALELLDGVFDGDSQRGEAGSKAASLPDAIADVLTEEVWLTAAEITDAIIDRGVRVKGRRDAAAVGVALSRHGEKRDWEKKRVDGRRYQWRKKPYSAPWEPPAADDIPF